MFGNLKSLQFHLFMDNRQLTFDFKQSMSFSSNITQLHVAIDNFNDCLYILDGSFNQMQKLYIVICGTGDLPSNDHENASCSSISCFTRIIDYFERAQLLYCHVYSYRYTWKFYHYITNNFHGGLFKSVREITLYDEHPFEHDFFLRIAQSFLCINKLALCNNEAQQNNHHQ
ncbi:unnamed protein product [Rotaria magnacalcarata]|uniref:Uncharacterized protein n=1 Tax=Rotaria magnacalcarata TaxID=392030 RepID=A0A816YZI2_9BILA|nr:unnamed protein product [Rotaria magnacalcarata]CAF2176677.1 unnamed protein product [Rotaria magnacalcarata]